MRGSDATRAQRERFQRTGVRYARRLLPTAGGFFSSTHVHPDCPGRLQLRESSVTSRAATLRPRNIEIESQFQNEVYVRPNRSSSEILAGTRHAKVSELERLRQQESSWKSTEANLEKQIAALKEASAKPEPPVEPPTQGEIAKLQQQLTEATARAIKAEQAEASLRKTNDELLAKVAALDPLATIKQLLRAIHVRLSVRPRCPRHRLERPGEPAGRRSERERR